MCMLNLGCLQSLQFERYWLNRIPVSLIEALPLLIIIGASVGGGCVFIVCVITLVSICCRHTAKGEVKCQMLSECSYSLLKKHDTVEIKRTN